MSLDVEVSRRPLGISHVNSNGRDLVLISCEHDPKKMPEKNPWDA